MRRVSKYQTLEKVWCNCTFILMIAVSNQTVHLRPPFFGAIKRLPKTILMLYSHSHQEQSFDYFASFLRNVLRGENQYKALVEPVIEDVKSLAKNEKDFFKVSNQSFDVIVYLAQKEPNYFIHLGANLTNQDYEHILGLVTAQREVIPA